MDASEAFKRFDRELSDAIDDAKRRGVPLEALELELQKRAQDMRELAEGQSG